MAFRFSLAAVLRFRQSLERQQELLLQEANQRVVLARQGVEEAERMLAAMATESARKLGTGVTAAELQFDLLWRSLAAARRQALETQLAACEKARTERLQSFQQARREHEAVEALRQRQFEAYHQQEVQHEQRRLDDMFLLRREFLRRR
jgi:flagellar export protein FliJ